MTNYSKDSTLNVSGSVQTNQLGRYGWICPKCESVYAPWVSKCLECGKTEKKETIPYIPYVPLYPWIPLKQPWYEPYIQEPYTITWGSDSLSGSFSCQLSNSEIGWVIDKIK